MDVREASNSKDFKTYDTNRIRQEFLIDNLFEGGKVNLVYSYIDRIIVGGVIPLDSPIKLEASKELRCEYFLTRREMGVINIANDGKIIVDGIIYEMKKYDCLYIGKGSKEIIFFSNDAKNPAKFYLNSVPAHQEYPTTHAPISKATPVNLGVVEKCNQRTIYKYIYPNGIKSCQLVMGLTMLNVGSVWNTIPPHTHDRRMEVYLYFDLGNDDVVFHLMGNGDETRHVVVKNEQAIISPSWSIHSGCGTRNYTFIWGMCGENQDFDDMDAIQIKNMK